MTLEQEVEHLRVINHELVCSHNDLLLALVRTEEMLKESRREVELLGERLRVLEFGFG